MNLVAEREIAGPRDFLVAAAPRAQAGEGEARSAEAALAEVPLVVAEGEAEWVLTLARRLLPLRTPRRAVCPVNTGNKVCA